MKRVAIALGGGAPNLTLMTGALLALDEAGVDVQVITTTGAGMVAGLLYAAPRREGPEETVQQARRRALRQTREMGIDDAIYDHFPVNYKIFQKQGKLAEAYAHAVDPFVWSIPRDTRRQRLLGDTLGFMAAMMQPMQLSAKSQGLCQPPPWIDLMVDFDELVPNLEEGDKKFRLTAYCLEDEKERTFNKHEIGREEFKAGLAMPFLYSPYKIRHADGTVKTYLEGSAFRTMEFNPEDVMNENHIDTVVYFDLMGNKQLRGEPKNLIDAWGRSIVAPLTQLAQQQVAIESMKRQRMNNIERLSQELCDFRNHTQEALDLIGGLREAIDALDREAGGKPELAAAVSKLRKVLDEKDMSQQAKDDLDGRFSHMEIHAQLAELGMSISKAGDVDQALTHQLLRMPFRDHIAPEKWDYVLDWSHSNMSYLFDVGYETAQCFVERNWDLLGLEQNGRPDPWEEAVVLHPVWGEQKVMRRRSAHDHFHRDDMIVDENEFESADGHCH